MSLAPDISIDIAVEAGDWVETAADYEALCHRVLLTTIETVIELNGPAEVSVLLSDDAAIQVLNRDWRAKDKPTNVLSFPARSFDDPVTGGPEMLGDIAVAFETTVREAVEQDKTFADHLSHLLVHGMLHLLGFDHETDAQADEMEPLEIEILAGLGVDSPYPDRN